jgi:hypothetical protein
MDLTGTGSDGMDQIHVIRMQTGDDRFLWKCYESYSSTDFETT